MRRCVELSATAVSQRELPFSCVICRDGVIVAEATNRVVQDGDVTRHAEILAISEAQRVLGRKDLSDCTIYSSVEPCPMCSFPIRETGIARVIYSISSPMMGGFSKWNVLGDNEISECDAARCSATFPKCRPACFIAKPPRSGGIGIRCSGSRSVSAAAWQRTRTTTRTGRCSFGGRRSAAGRCGGCWPTIARVRPRGAVRRRCGPRPNWDSR